MKVGNRYSRAPQERAMAVKLWSARSARSSNFPERTDCPLSCQESPRLFKDARSTMTSLREESRVDGTKIFQIAGLEAREVDGRLPQALQEQEQIGHQQGRD